MSTNRQQRRINEKRQNQKEKLIAFASDAEKAFLAKDYEGSACFFGKALQFDPDNIQLLYSQGQMLVMAGKHALAISPLQKAVARVPTNAELQKELGTALRYAGREKEAIPYLKEALRLNPALADAHFTLAIIAREKPDLGLDMEELDRSIGDKRALIHAYKNILAILKAQSQLKEAEVCMKELCRLCPDAPDVWIDLAVLQIVLGKHTEAVQNISKAITIKPDHSYKSFLANALFGAHFHHFMPEVKAAILVCFENIYDVSLWGAFSGWFNLLKEDPAFVGFVNALLLDEEDKVFQWLDTLNEKNSVCLRDPYLLQGLRLLTLTMPRFEILITRLRRYLCLNFETLTSNGRLFLFEPLLMALAEQCFFNEYVFEETQVECEAIEFLMRRMKETRGDSVASAALLGCYRPLGQIFSDHEEILRKLARKHSDFASVVKTQVEDSLEEKRLKETVPIFDAIGNSVSQSVRSQYEENPYPRWITVNTKPSQMDNSPVPEERRYDPWNILIAGCGTGRHAISVAARHPNARLVAIDLSRASLAYASRKAIEAGLSERIKFIQADILSMKDYQGSFDMIECAGVLHHMQDPFKGWEALTGILKKDGYMMIGLYSEKARQYIIETRDLVSERGYQATTQGIRAFRKDIMARPNSDSLKEKLTSSNDFYTTSLVRDLVFHVQEHRMTLPQISTMMKRLNLEMHSMSIMESETARIYNEMFPDDPKRKNLNHWHEFEQKYPDTFVSMYQFWCQKA